MKKHSALLVALFIITFLSCKKDKAYNPDDVRLVGTESFYEGNLLRTLIEYNSAGNISRVSYQENDKTPTIGFDVLYVNNEVLLVDPPVSNSATEIRDTIRLQFGTDNRVAKRIHQMYFEVKPPTGAPQRTYNFDTTVYQYDAAGMLTKTTHNIQDSTWFNNGAVTITNEFTQGVTNYTVNGGNLISSDFASTRTTIGTTPTNTYVYTRTSTSNTTLEYKKQFLNKTDFSNIAILNELALFAPMPMNKQYSLLPSKITESYTNRDQNGAVISSGSGSAEYEFQYNLFGLVISRINSANPDAKLIYKYTY